MGPLKNLQRWFILKKKETNIDEKRSEKIVSFPNKILVLDEYMGNSNCQNTLLLT